jgi:hypothetical protein
MNEHNYGGKSGLDSHVMHLAIMAQSMRNEHDARGKDLPSHTVTFEIIVTAKTRKLCVI